MKLQALRTAQRQTPLHSRRVCLAQLGTILAAAPIFSDMSNAHLMVSTGVTVSLLLRAIRLATHVCMQWPDALRACTHGRHICWADGRRLLALRFGARWGTGDLRQMRTEMHDTIEELLSSTISLENPLADRESLPAGISTHAARRSLHKSWKSCTCRPKSRHDRQSVVSRGAY